MARFRYHVLQHEESYELKADGPTAPRTIDQPYVSDPKWAVKNAVRNREQRLSRGYYATTVLAGTRSTGFTCQTSWTFCTRTF